MSRAPFVPSPIWPMARAHNEALCAAAKAAGDRWRTIPGVGTGRMGLTPEHVRLSPEYKQARAEFERLNAIACEYTRFCVATFHREMALDREAYRAKLLAGRQSA